MVETLKILLIEPDVIDRQLIEYVLRNERADVSFYEPQSPEELEFEISKNIFDIVITNISSFSLPQGEIIRLLRKLLPFISIIATSKSPDELLKSIALANGANRFLFLDKKGINKIPKIITAFISESNGVNWNKIVLPESYRNSSNVLMNRMTNISEITVLINESMEVIYKSAGLIELVKTINNIYGRDSITGELSCLISKNFGEGCLADESCSSGLKRKVLESITSGRRYEHEILKVVKTNNRGHFVDLVYSITPLTVNQNKLILLSFEMPGTINQLKLAVSRNEEFNRRVIASMAEGLIVQTESAEILDINKAGEKMLGLPRNQIVGKKGLTSIFNFYDENGHNIPEDQMPEYMTLKTGRSFSNVRMEIKSHDKTVMWVSVNTEPMFIKSTEQPDAVVTTFTDITVMKKALDRLVGYQRNLRSLSAQLTIAEEQEKRRIALNLHDHISQELSLSRIKLNQILRMSLPEEAKILVEETEKLVTDTIRNSRKITNELSPPILFEMGLVSALKWKIEQENSIGDVHIRFNNISGVLNTTESVGILLFRSVSELITNAKKHSGTDVIELNIAHGESSITVSVRDSGNGFIEGWDTNPDSNTHRFGLFSIKERIQYFGGTMEIKTERNQGSEIILTIPKI